MLIERTPRESSCGPGVVVVTSAPPSRTRPARAVIAAGATGAKFSTASNGPVTVLDVAAGHVGAVSADPLGVALTGGPDRRDTGLHGELDGEAADGPTGAVDQNPLAGLDAGVLEQSLPGGEPDGGQRRGVGQRDLAGAAARTSAGASTYSAAAPSAVIGRNPTTRSPTVKPVAPSPSAATVPATSMPGVCGRVSGKTCCR